MLVNFKVISKNVGGGTINKKTYKNMHKIMHDSWESGDLGMLVWNSRYTNIHKPWEHLYLFLENMNTI